MVRNGRDQARPNAQLLVGAIFSALNGNGLLLKMHLAGASFLRRRLQARRRGRPFQRAVS